MQIYTKDDNIGYSGHILLDFKCKIHRIYSKRIIQLVTIKIEQVGFLIYFSFFTILESETLPFNGSFDFGLIGSPKYFFKKSFIIIISILLVTLNYILPNWIDLAKNFKKCRYSQNHAIMSFFLWSAHRQAENSTIMGSLLSNFQKGVE